MFIEICQKMGKTLGINVGVLLSVNYLHLEQGLKLVLLVLTVIYTALQIYRVYKQCVRKRQ